MNERIKLLAEQAGLKWKAQPPHYTNTNNPIDFPVSANRDLEKFAELIVAECTTVIEKNLFKGIGWNTSRKVKQHFGIGDEE